MSSTKCLIYERDVNIHRLQHVRHLADALLDVGCELVIALQSDARRHEEYTMHMQPLEPHAQIRTNLDPEQKSDYFSAARRVNE